MAKKTAPKRIVYLWGAGATHAEAQRLGRAINLLMRNHPHFGDGIATRVLQRAGRRAEKEFGTDEGVDIEKLISLLVACGVDEHTKLAEKLRENYFLELRASLSSALLLDGPPLATQLLRMHGDVVFQDVVEALSGIITTNHDGLLQIASQRVFGAVNLGFDFQSKRFQVAKDRPVPPILQLHGSFTWRFGLPIQVEPLNQRSGYENTVWIPPTILKESKTYPFNKLAGQAYELLARQCDVLRVIGTSLTQNDWNILSLIFNAQRHREITKGSAFRIELIMPRGAGETIEAECAYLKNLTTVGHLTDGNFGAYNDDLNPITPESDLANPFAYWLNEKIEFHRTRHEVFNPHPAEIQMAGAHAP